MDNGSTRGCALLITIIGLIASVIGIYVFLTGHQTLEAALKGTQPSLQTAPAATAVLVQPSRIAPTTSLQPLRRGTVQVTLDGWYAQGHPQRFAYSFESGRPASTQVPADITIRECTIFESQDPTCTLDAAKIWSLEYTPLTNIPSKPTPVPAFLFFPGYEAADVGSTSFDIKQGKSYVVVTYSGHLAKFRIASIEQHEANLVSFTLEWVYQTNERDDFSGE